MIYGSIKRMPTNLKKFCISLLTVEFLSVSYLSPLTFLHTAVVLTIFRILQCTKYNVRNGKLPQHHLITHASSGIALERRTNYTNPSSALL